MQLLGDGPLWTTSLPRWTENNSQNCCLQQCHGMQPCKLLCHCDSICQRTTRTRCRCRTPSALLPVWRNCCEMSRKKNTAWCSTFQLLVISVLVWSRPKTASSVSLCQKLSIKKRFFYLHWFGNITKHFWRLWNGCYHNLKQLIKQFC